MGRRDALIHRRVAARSDRGERRQKESARSAREAKRSAKEATRQSQSHGDEGGKAVKYCNGARDRADALEAKAKKRARDSSSVESGIVKKLVKRCTCCKLCRVCEFMHEQYRRSKC